MPIHAVRFDTAIDEPDTLPRAVEGAAPVLTIAFVGAADGLVAASERLAGAFEGPVLACTTAGELSSAGLRSEAIVGVALGGDLTVDQVAHRGLADLGHAALGDTIHALRRAMERRPAGTTTFGLVIVDGLSIAEERLMAALSTSFPTVDFVGGSAGDGLRFGRTGVWWDGALHADLAVITLVHTPQPWIPLKTQHFSPSEPLLVITEADPSRRVVREIDGFPAARAYAMAVGVDVADLSPEVYSKPRPFIIHLLRRRIGCCGGLSPSSTRCGVV